MVVGGGEAGSGIFKITEDTIGQWVSEILEQRIEN